MAPASLLGRFLGRYLGRLRFPWLFFVLAGLLLVDLVTPDPIPLLDELMLAVLTLVAGSWKNRPQQSAPPPAPGPSQPAQPEPLTACDACGLLRPAARLRATADGRHVCADGCRGSGDRSAGPERG